MSLTLLQEAKSLYQATKVVLTKVVMASLVDDITFGIFKDAVKSPA